MSAFASSASDLEVSPATEYVLSLDPGQGRNDPSALIGLARVTPYADGRQVGVGRYHLTHAVEYGQPKEMVSRCRLTHVRASQVYPRQTIPLVVDTGGVGEYVTRPLVEAGLPVISVKITGGDGWRHAHTDEYHFSAKILAGVGADVVTNNRLTIEPGLKLADTIMTELLNFTATVNARTGNIHFGAGPSEFLAHAFRHDDLVFALLQALAVYELVWSDDGELDPLLVKAFIDGGLPR